MSPSGDGLLADLFLGRPKSRRYPKFNIRRDIPGVRVFAISVDPPETQAAFRAHLGAEFTFLSDQEKRLIDRLNIRHSDQYRKANLAFPTAILVDKYGIVRWIYEMPYGNTRMTPHELFEAIERMTLEEQNRELLRARAVSQVVRQVFLMERSADLAKAIRVMQDELHGPGPGVLTMLDHDLR